MKRFFIPGVASCNVPSSRCETPVEKSEFAGCAARRHAPFPRLQLLSPPCCNLKGLQFQYFIHSIHSKNSSSHQSCLVFFPNWQKICTFITSLLPCRLQWLQFCLEDSEGSWSCRWDYGTSAFTSWRGEMYSWMPLRIEHLVLVKSNPCWSFQLIPVDLLIDWNWLEFCRHWSMMLLGSQKYTWIRCILKSGCLPFFWGSLDASRPGQSFIQPMSCSGLLGTKIPGLGCLWKSLTQSIQV